MRTVVFMVMGLLALPGGAAQVNPERARFNYQMFCQGCHTPDGSGAMSVPRLKGHMGRFLQTQPGRAYLVRVPGSATSALGNAELAEVLNWMLQEFSGASLDASFRPYSAGEVASLRQSPLNEVVQYRAQLLRDIAIAEQQQGKSGDD